MQALTYAGLPDTIPATTVHKVCASGMKTAMFAADSIILGRADIVVAGGFESMSNIPHYLPTLRSGQKMGDSKLVDGVIYDGLWDPYGNVHMGVCGELCASEMNISREAQDAFARATYERALSEEALKVHAEQIVPLDVPAGRGKTVTVAVDGEPAAANLEKMTSLKPAFKKEGTITAANASKINDGAAAMVIMSASEAKRRGVKPLAAIRGSADANQKPDRFTTTPAKAVPIAVERAGLQMKDMELHEINEAFSVVALANMQLLNLESASVNIYGGAVALGHPIGASGARIIGQLAHALRARGKRYGTASICNGGGGASAMVLEALE
jgi:acetyl-CoA C-acetyltransferase